jgi:pimeloyl-[acyl-carrier protein] methyl ester esterase
MRLNSQSLGAGRELVMVHGWGMNSSVWIDFAERMAEDYRVTLIDLPGHGLSPYHGQVRLEDWAAAALEVAPQHGVWLGWSLGSMVTLQAGLLAPERFDGIIALAGMPRFVQGEDWPHAMAMRTLNNFIEVLGDDLSRAMERFLALQMLGSDLAMETLKRLKLRLQERPHPIPEALQAGLDLLKSGDLRRQLRDLSCPTAWLYGERDTLAPAAAAQRLVDWLPEVKNHTIARAAHTPFLSHPQETERWVRETLEAWYA